MKPFDSAKQVPLLGEIMKVGWNTMMLPVERDPFSSCYKKGSVSVDLNLDSSSRSCAKLLSIASIVEVPFASNL